MEPTTTHTIDKPIIPLKDIQASCDVMEDGNRAAARICRVGGELRQGYYHIGHYKKSVTFFGGARFVEHDPYYEKARALAGKIVKETGFAVVTGGGPGIMEAANRGAKEAGGNSVGVTIKLPTEQETNPYVTEDIPFEFFFTRKTILTYGAEAYIAFPGGYGTIDELFEILTLFETKKVPRVPVFLYGAEFWNPLIGFIKQTLLEKNKTIDMADIAFFKVTDDDDEIIAALKISHVVSGY